MVVGLTFRELLDEFGKSYSKRLKEAKVELMTSDMGLNPLTKSELDRIQREYGLTNTESTAQAIFLMAILDTIAKNNESISKTISPPK